MLFIFGVKTRRKTLDSGRFSCPNEGGSRRYRRVRARRWFTFFFVPVVPLGKQGEWVQCQSCSATYPSDILRRSV